MRFPHFADSNSRVRVSGGADSRRVRTFSGSSISRRFSLLVLTLTLFFLHLNVAAQEPTKRVLILTGSDPNHPGFSVITKSIASTLRANSQSRVELLYELQQSLLDPTGSNAGNGELASYLKRKYGDKKIDLVLVMAAPRFRILSQKDPGLFGNIPKIFYDFDTERDSTNRALGPNISGVWASLDLYKTLDLAFALHPDTRKVVVISGTSPLDKIVRERAQAQFRKYESRAEFSYVTGDTIQELKTKLSALDKKSVVIFLTFTSDRVGNNYSGPEILSVIAPASSAPIYGYSDTLMGLGITGGNLFDFDAIGRRIGEMSLRVFAGERPERIPQETAPTVMTVDWRELQRWGISEQRLPPGSVVRFKTPTFWDLNKWYVLVTIAALIFEALLIVRLLFTQTRRRQAERESKRLTRLAKAEHKRLGEIVSNVPGIVWETVIDPITKQRKTTFVSDYVEKMLGYTAKEWLSQPPGFGVRIIPEEEDRQRSMRDSEAVMASGKEGFSQYRWNTKDGRTLWVESYLSPIGEDERVVGLRGVTLDITEGKLAEETLRQTEEKDRAILNAIPDLMFLQTRDGVYLDYHAKDHKDLLVPPVEFLGKNMREVLPPELAEDFFRCFQRAEEMGEPQILEYKLTLNESERWFESRMVRSGQNILTLVRDITQRIFIEEAIKRNEAQLAGIIGSAMDAIITVDEDQRIMLFNEAAEKIFGCSQAEVMGQSLDRFVPERFRAAHRKHIREFGEKNITRRLAGTVGDLYGLRSSGEEFPMEASISQIELSGQTFYTIILRDITDRKLAEAALKESEVNYRSIFNAANDAIFVHDLKTGAILDVNERMCEMYGYTVEEARRLSVGDLSSNEPAYTQEQALTLIEKTATGQPQLFEWHAKDKSGRLFWVEMGLRHVLLGGKDCLLAIVRDITERKNAMDELRQSEERFGKGFRANPQPMSLTTLANGLYLDVNESFLEMSGYSREEVIGHTSNELRIWKTPESRVDFVEQLKHHGSLVNVETKFRTRNGSLRLLLSSAEQLEIGGEECLLVASSDVTERMVAQQALQESEARFRNMADTAPVMIWMSGTDKLCNYFNQQWLDFTGRTMAEEMGNGWTQGVYPDDKSGCLETYTTNFDTRRSFEMEYRLRRADGEYRWIFNSGTPRFSADGEFLGYIGSCLDVTERRESEQALRKAHEELHELKNQLEAENIYLQQELQFDQAFGEMVGQSDALKYVLFKTSQVAATDSTVLVTGETGTGKELVARAIHGASSRKDRSLIRVNCAALPANLIESELFGHEKGAFTGAVGRKLGRFELASGGTIFLDEIGDLPLESQVKLLRVIQEGEFERLGSAKTIKIDVRIIAATNRNLKLEIERGTFREDLWYRLNVFPITVPPLRQRKEDIPLLIEHFVSKSAKKFGKTITSISPRTMRNLQEHSWPGNIRELANVIERAVIHTQGNVLHVVDHFETPSDSLWVVKSLEEVEREYIVRTLENTGWRIEGPSGAARILGLNPSTLRTRMIKLGIHKQSLSAAS